MWRVSKSILNDAQVPVKAWAAPAAVIVAAELAVASTIGWRVGFRYSIPVEIYAIIAFTFVGVAAAVMIVARLIAYAWQKENNPTRRLMREAPAFSGFALGSLLVAMQISVLTWTKIMLPIANPFWADPLLANIDHLLFGRDPWIIAHDLFGWAASLIDRVYITWAPIKFATTVFVLVMPETRTKARAMTSYFIMLAAVAVGQYLLSSAGPVFYEQFGFGSRFEQLPLEPWVQDTQFYLWHDYLKAGGDIGGGISAMPSLHVAAALWIALVWNAYDRRAGLVGLAYFFLILVGSVLLGWHYAVDAIAGVLITGVAWSVAPMIANLSIALLSNARTANGNLRHRGSFT